MVYLSGPPYPPLPAAGSNGIGILEIGESQIGDIVPFDWRATIISQYANSNNLTQLIENFDAYIDQTENISLFYDLVMNLDTAQGVWPRRLGTHRRRQSRVADHDWGLVWIWRGGSGR